MGGAPGPSRACDPSVGLSRAFLELAGRRQTSVWHQSTGLTAGGGGGGGGGAHGKSQFHMEEMDAT